METVFYAEEPDQYIAALVEAGYTLRSPLDWDTTTEIGPPTEVINLRVYANADMNEDRYVAWTDRRLMNEYLQWLAIYD